MNEFWLNFIIQFAASYVATFSFAILFRLSWKKCLFAGIAGTIGWLVYYLLKEYLGLGLSTILAAASLAAFCRILAVLTKTPGTAYLVPGIVPLVPGAGIYYTIYYLLSYNFQEAAHRGADTLIVSGAIVFGIALVNPIRWKKKH